MYPHCRTQFRKREARSYSKLTEMVRLHVEQKKQGQTLPCQEQRQKVLQDEIQKGDGKASSHLREVGDCTQWSTEDNVGEGSRAVSTAMETKRRRRREDPVLGPKQEKLENRWTCSDQRKCAQMHESARRVA